MIKYLGSKRLLAPAIVDVLRRIPNAHSLLDLFSGTSRVGHAAKRAGFRVESNDALYFAATLARCYVQADADRSAEARALLAELACAPPSEGYFTETFCREARFFQEKNGRRIDGMREALARMPLDDDLHAIALVALMEAADRVDSTTGVQMAYVKSYAPRSFNDLKLRLPDLLPRAPMGAGRAHQLDARDAARLDVDVAYLDPPYNQHSYLGNYHAWETLVLWDQPEAYGVARKRIDCRTRKSPFNSKKQALQAMREVIAAVRAPWLLVSFNDEGYIARSEIEAMLRCRAYVQTVELPYRRYVGAKIGIHDRAGNKVGAVGRTRNVEYLFVAGPELLNLDGVVESHVETLSTAARFAGPLTPPALAGPGRSMIN